MNAPARPSLVDLAVGVLPDFEIHRAIETGAILAPALLPGQIQPSSIDLRLGTRAHRLRASFLPGAASVEDRLVDLTLHSFDITDGAVLETDAVYLIELQEELRLPPEVAVKANPKSSTGRLDVFVRLIADGAKAFDAVPAGYQGKLWLEVVPKTFPVLVRPGSRLAQARLHRGDTRLADVMISELNVDLKLTDAVEAVVRNGLCLGVDLTPDVDGIVGWRARRNAGVVDVDRVAGYDRHEFWDPVTVRPKGGMVLEPGEFYILCSREAVAVPPGYASEMLPFDAGIGEFRAHYAGFFDPGFGWGEGNASRAVLEVRARDVPFLVEHGQIVAKLGYERMAGLPEGLYGQGLKSNYQGQGLKLSKHFV